MEKYSTRLMIVFVTLLGSLALAGCATLGTSTPLEPTATATLIATSTPTVVPTETSTPTQEPLNADNFKVENGQIEENVGGSWQTEQIPSEVGEIASVELHEGQMYGIDTADRAVVVRNASGEWVKFDRPILGYGFDNVPVDDLFPGEVDTWHIENGGTDFPDVPASEITRLTNTDGTPVVWGYQKGSYVPSDPDFQESDPLPDNSTGNSINIAGYFLGDIKLADTTDFNGKTATSNYTNEYVFEIPYKYARQVIVVVPPFGKDDSFNFSFGDTNGQIKTYQLSYDEARKFIDDNMQNLPGQECVISIDLNSTKTNQEFWQAVKNGLPYDYLGPETIYDTAWFNQNLAPK